MGLTVLAALTLDAVRVAVVAALVLVVLPRALLPRNGSTRGLEDAVRMTALVAMVTLGLAATGLLDPVALMLSLVAAGTVLRLVPAATRAQALAGRRAALGRFYDLLERRRAPTRASELVRRSGVPLALVSLAGLALLTSGPAGDSDLSNARYLAGLDYLEESGRPTGDDPAEGAVTLLAALGNLVQIDARALVSSAPALAFAAAAAATVAVTWRLTGLPLASVLAGGAHILAAELTVPGAGAGTANVDVIALNAAAALALLAAVLVVDLRRRDARLDPAAVAVALAGALHPLAAAAALVGGASGLVFAVLTGRAPGSVALSMLAPAAALVLVLGAVGADGAVADGLLTEASPAPLELMSVMAVSDLVTASAVGFVIAGVVSVASRPRAQGAPAILALCVLAGSMLASTALPGNSSLLTDEGARIIAAPSVAVLLGLAWAGLSRRRLSPQAGAQAAARASRSPS